MRCPSVAKTLSRETRAVKKRLLRQSARVGAASGKDALSFGCLEVAVNPAPPLARFGLVCMLSAR